MFNLSAFDCLTDVERELYDKYKSAKKAEKDTCRLEFENKLSEHAGTRTILKSKLYWDNGNARLDNTIALFESEAARMSDDFQFDKDNPKEIPLIRDYVVLDCTIDIVWKQIVANGVNIAEEHYIFFSSSTNHQKQKRMGLVKEDFYNEHQDKFMNGLSLEVVNAKGGCNTGKYLAYNSLIFSQSVQLDEPISIDEVLVLPEFETDVMARVNYLDMDTQIVEEREMPVKINHMDGAGLFLPGVLPQSAQIRNGYIKGCIFPFDFRQFIIEAQENGRIPDGATVKDIWDDEWSIDWIRDNVKVILNGSMIKMWKYYGSWEEYKEAFKRNNLEICINNMLHYPTTTNPLVMSAYQFYQTIPRENMPDEKIKNLCNATVEAINRYKTNVNAVFEVMGVDKDSEELEPFYAALKTYPEMVRDSYVRKKVKAKIESIREKGMAGKPYIKGFYNYICPDLYAACEHWFCGEINPQGLISEGFVYNAFYNDGEVQNVEEVCCLRSPHLSDCEHGMRNLIKSDECRKWFHGLDTVISTHDLLTKTLTCDVDGDETLITHDRAFLDLVDRSKLPLHYEMKKAEPVIIDTEAIIKCLESSFNNSIIGDISNALTKHWNLPEEPDIDFARVMTAYNNFVIDYPKSQYMPELKKDYQEIFETLRVEKYPHFFHFAKGKPLRRCHKPCDKSNVDRISEYIKDRTSDDTKNIWKHEFTSGEDTEKKKFNPEYFQLRDYKVDRNSAAYQKLMIEMERLKNLNNLSFRDNLKKRYMNSLAVNRLGYEPFYHYCSYRIREIIEADYKISEKIEIRKKTAAYLLDIEYYQRKNRDLTKDILWTCFGDILYENLCDNLEALNSGEISEIKVKKAPYQNASNLNKEIEEAAKRTKEELDAVRIVPITKKEFEYVQNLKCRKGSEKDRYLLYCLIVLYKRHQKWLKDSKKDNYENLTLDRKTHFKIYNKSKKGKTTRATLDKWLEGTVAKKGLKRLDDVGIIKINSCVDHDKIYIPFLKDTVDVEDDKKEFDVNNTNPMFDYYKYTGERKVNECETCNSPFLVVGNMKTCGKKSCAEDLEKKTKREYKNS